MYKITEELATKLKGKTFKTSMRFNPVQDINDDWFITEFEVDECVNLLFLDNLKSLTKSEFIAKTYNLIKQ